MVPSNLGGVRVGGADVLIGWRNGGADVSVMWQRNQQVVAINYKQSISLHLVAVTGLFCDSKWQRRTVIQAWGIRRLMSYLHLPVDSTATTGAVTLSRNLRV